MTPEDLWRWAAILPVAAPSILVLLLALSGLRRRRLAEPVVVRMTHLVVLLAGLGAIAGTLLAVRAGHPSVSLDVLRLLHVPDTGFELRIVLLYDRLSIPFLFLSVLLVGIVGAFAGRYLHREPGFHRFFLLYAVFLLGMTTASLAGTIETLFVGWELVGLSSALLVGFFQERRLPVEGAQRVWWVYRTSDAAFLLAVVAFHHLAPHDALHAALGDPTWPDAVFRLSNGGAMLVGGLVLVAVMGKSALLPFSGWLPRAMEGPTPSSAIFYGALSVHLGVFLLLRMQPILADSLPFAIATVAIGILTAVYAASASRVQPDIKGSIAYASIAQVGVITVEIGLGLHWIALVHICGHAVLRTLQLLRAPSLLHDYHRLGNAVSRRRSHDDHHGTVPTSSISPIRYRLAFDRDLPGALLDRLVANPIGGVLLACDRLERRVLRAMCGGEAGDAAEIGDDDRPATAEAAAVESEEVTHVA